MFADPKTTITAIVGFIAFLLTRYGVDLGPDVQAAIVVLTMFFIGLFAKDGSKAES